MGGVARAEQLTHRIGGREVLSSVSLTVRDGEVLGLIGPNGGGKSTLLMLLAGLLRPSEGAVTVLGYPAHQLAQRRTGAVGLITASPGLYPLLTGWENLHFFSGLYGLSRQAVARQAAPWLDRTGLTEAMDRPVGGWSTGMQQRLSLVRALLLDPSLLLLDEPTANLDPLGSREMHRAVREAAGRGVAVVLVTHDLTGAEAICDRVALLRRQVLRQEALTGERALPPEGRLLRLYREAL
ncbi:MAG: ABC transporter ATP-binding protein [Deltaproteobacteria bacterium]|nr:ABC transporter ATP-binding protein [Deltaproteobacteria bacterium]